MAKILNNRRFLITAWLLITSFGAQAQDNPGTGAFLDGIVAVVNDGVVLRSELDRQVEAISTQLLVNDVELPPADVLEKQILERLVIEEIQIQRAGRLGIGVTDDMVNAGISRVAQRAGITLSDLPEVLAQQGVDYISYRDNVRREMTLDQLRQRDLMGRISVTKEEAEQYLASANAADDNEYEISQILIPAPSDGDPEVLAELQAKIDDIHAQLEDGKDFGSLAVSFSAGQNALSGGKIGWRKHSELPKLFADAVATLTPGKFSTPIRSNSGFHIVRLDDKRGNSRPPVIVTEFQPRHILIETNEIRTESAALAKAQTLYQRLSNGEDFTELAKNESDDRGSATSGGDLGWSGPGVFVPPFEAKLRELEVGELSGPVKTQFGYHIIELMDKRQSDKTEEAILNEAAGQIRVRKAQEESESWLLRMRDEAFVDYRL
ncbi:MAG: peptidylprolyl isomerase [Gammaproteobacteria bacterium]